MRKERDAMSYAERHPLPTVIENPSTPESRPEFGPESPANPEYVARELLGISAEAAFAKLDAGELDGTVASDALRSARWLRG
jgi:hypothetical protein